MQEPQKVKRTQAQGTGKVPESCGHSAFPTGSWVPLGRMGHLWLALLRDGQPSCPSTSSQERCHLRPCATVKGLWGCE